MDRPAKPVQHTVTDIHGSGRVFLIFHASWSMPCRSFVPLVASVGVEFAGRAHLVFVDVAKDADVARTYGVSSLPTVLVLSSGRVVARMVGARPRAELQEELRRHVD